MVNSPIFLMLEGFDMFKVLTNNELAELSNCVVLKRVEKNKFIYRKDEEMDYVYLVRKGTVKLGVDTLEGRSLIKDVVYDNELFGENIFVGGEKRREYAKTMAETSLIKIPVGCFNKLVEQNKEFSVKVINLIIQRVETLENRIQSFILKDAKNRIIDFVKRTGEKRGFKNEAKEVTFHHKMSHKEIAHLTDTSRQTVARVLSELKKDNIIHFPTRRPNKIVIKNMVNLA